MISIKEIFAQKNKVIIWSLIVFLFAFSIRVFWINQKEGIHIDEGYTHVISSFVGYNWAKDYNYNYLYTGKEIKDITFKNTTSEKQTLKDLAELRRNNDYDFNHSNMYYSLYRIWMMSGSDVLSLKEFVNRACGLNLVFFSISFFLMYKLLRRIFEDKRVVPLGLAAAFLNTGSISNTLFIRPYQLQETIFLLLSFVFVDYYKKISNNENIITIKDFSILTIVLGLTILSGYFSLIYMGILGLILLVLCLKNKNYKNTWLLTGGVFSALIFALIIYPAYFKGFTSFRAEQAFSTISTTGIAGKKILLYIAGLWNTSINYLLYFPVLILLIAGCFKRDKECKVSKLPKILILSGIVWALLIMYLAPYKILRYVMPIFPVVSIVIPLTVYCAKTSAKKVIAILCFLLLIINSCMASPRESYETKFRTSNIRRIPFGAAIENLNVTVHSKSKFVEKPELPVVFVNDMTKCVYINIVPYFIDNQTYEFADNFDKNLMTKYSHYYLLVCDYLNDMFEAPKGYKVIDNFNLGGFKGYELVKE